MSLALGLVTTERAERVNLLLDRLGLGIEPPEVARESVIEHMASDKKHSLGRLNWILPTDTGVVIRSDVPDSAVAAGVTAALRGARHAAPATQTRSETGVP
jgi:3-dehydroquinate synthetase